MRNAPSVRFPVGRCRLYGVLLGFLAALSGVVLGLWCLLDGAPGFSWPAVAGTVLWLLWGASAVRAWWRSPVGQLRWSASERRDPGMPPGIWHWHSAPSPDGEPLQRVERVMDWQGAALLRLHPADAPARWVWVERHRDPAHWNDLRRALMAAQP